MADPSYCTDILALAVGHQGDDLTFFLVRVVRTIRGGENGLVFTVIVDCCSCSRSRGLVSYLAGAAQYDVFFCGHHGNGPADGRFGQLAYPSAPLAHGGVLGNGPGA